MSAEFMSIATTLKAFEAHFVDISTAAEEIRGQLEQLALTPVGPGATCSYFEPESAEWRDAVFHKWCENPASPQAIVHDQETGVCLLIQMAELRFKKALT